MLVSGQTRLCRDQHACMPRRAMVQRRMHDTDHRAGRAIPPTASSTLMGRAMTTEGRATSDNAASESMAAGESPNPDIAMMIEIAEVSLRRGARQLFDRLSLRLNERRIGLIGGNGSGKSSLLRLINGLLLPDSGEVHVGVDTTRSARDKVMAGFGFVFQNPDHQIIFPTVAEEIESGLTLRGLPRVDAKQAAQRLLVEHDCADWGACAIHELSEGQKQLVCILSALACQPHTLLLDECFASLDLRTRLELARTLRTLPQRQIMASHDLDLLAGFDRIIWLDDGHIRGDGTPCDIIPRYRAAMDFAAPMRRVGE